MRSGKCDVCGNSAPLGKMFRVTEGLRQSLQCETCADLKAEQADPKTVQFLFAVDPTICTHCHTDYGSTELPLVAGMPYCNTCRDTVLYNRPFPTWLQYSFAGLLLLLAVALVRGAPYFRAVRDMYRAERLMDQKQYAAAAQIMEGVVKIAPNSGKAILLGAKAYLLAGKPPEADAMVKHRETYKEEPLTAEVKGLFARVDKAFAKLEEASKATDSGQALTLLREAEKLYPEWPSWPEADALYEASAAFDRKDYDRFLALYEDSLKRHPQDAMLMGGVASALACKYAVTGDPEFRVRAEAMLEQAGSHSTSPGEKQAFQEYAERIRHRLRTREIISRVEYDRRFHPERKGK